jgi:hypothetical protein
MKMIEVEIQPRAYGGSNRPTRSVKEKGHGLSEIGRKINELHGVPTGD